MRAAALLCLLVVLAGCAGQGVGDPSVDAGGRGTPPDHSPSADATPTVDPASARASGDAPAAGNPWGADRVTVRIVAPAGDDRNYRPLVRAALDFWENQSVRYGFDYRITDDPDADVRVEFVANVSVCGHERDALDVGCAPFVRSGDRAPQPTRVEIETGYTNASTIGTLKHEIGHTRGYDHDDTDTYPFMAAESAVTRLPTPNATERANPWETDELRVYADYPDVIDGQRTEYEAAVAKAIDFYRTDEASTLPEGVTLTTIDDRADADVVIEFPGTGPSRSVGRVSGDDPDADSALERFVRYEISVNSIDRDRVAWHVGYWLGWAFGAASNDDLPEPFDEPEEDDREHW